MKNLWWLKKKDNGRTNVWFNWLEPKFDSFDQTLISYLSYYFSSTSFQYNFYVHQHRGSTTCDFFSSPLCLALQAHANRPLTILVFLECESNKTMLKQQNSTCCLRLLVFAVVVWLSVLILGRSASRFFNEWMMGSFVVSVFSTIPIDLPRQRKNVVVYYYCILQLY